MPRYVLRYGEARPTPSEHVQQIRATPGVHVLDESPNMLLVDGQESALREKLKKLPGWSMHPEQDYPLPDTRQRIK